MLRITVQTVVQAVPSDQPLTWRDKAELKDLYSVYVGRQPDTLKQSELRELLGISEAEADSLQNLVSQGQFHLEQAQKEEAFF